MKRFLKSFFLFAPTKITKLYVEELISASGRLWPSIHIVEGKKRHSAELNELAETLTIANIFRNPSLVLYSFAGIHGRLDVPRAEQLVPGRRTPRAQNERNDWRRERL